MAATTRTQSSDTAQTCANMPLFVMLHAPGIARASQVTWQSFSHELVAVGMWRVQNRRRDSPLCVVRMAYERASDKEAVQAAKEAGQSGDSKRRRGLEKDKFWLV